MTIVFTLNALGLCAVIAVKAKQRTGKALEVVQLAKPRKLAYLLSGPRFIEPVAKSATAVETVFFPR